MPRFSLLTETGTYNRSATAAYARREARKYRADGCSCAVAAKLAFEDALNRAGEQRGTFEHMAGLVAPVRVSAAPGEFADTFEQAASDARLAA